MASPDHIRTCPICGKPQDQHFRPFCSARCRDVDLHRWFSGAYSIPLSTDEAAGTDASEQEDADR